MTDYDPTSEESARDLCCRLNISGDDYWGDINNLACDAYYAGRQASRSEHKAEVGALERRIAQLEAQQQTEEPPLLPLDLAGKIKLHAIAQRWQNSNASWVHGESARRDIANLISNIERLWTQLRPVGGNELMR
jgi:hypothetical protein